MNPNWIKGDWYLNQGFPYRNLFNIIAGSLALFLPLNLVSVVGRLLTICFFTHILFLFKNLFKIPLLIYIPVIFLLNITQNDIGAGEGMSYGFETKIFAYIGLLYAFIFVFQNKWKLVLFLQGLAISFHVLIDLQSVFCLGIVILVYYRGNLKDILKALPLFFLGAFSGLYTLTNYFFQDVQSAQKIFATFFYVTFRVGHHTDFITIKETPIFLAKFLLLVLFLFELNFSFLK